jgi:NAD(P)H-dependent flavin oxidoreductase YrpB (nitropropane dioxygenase family)
MAKELNKLIIGDLEIKIPIIQGGMGVKISTASLVSAVANYGAAGTISSVGLGYGRPDNKKDYPKASREGLKEEIQKTKKLTNGIFGINAMVALSNYEDLIRTAVKEGVHFIASGAGLPLKLPELIEDSPVKLIPIVSSRRAADIIIKTWKKRYNRLPDAVIVEGPLAGGHLGYKYEELINGTTETLENIVKDVVKLIDGYEKEYGVKIPVIAGGGISTGKDIARFLRLGASGVQIATLFVTTHECSVADRFKQAYLSAKETDVLIIKSPVGMPGRAIRTKLIDKVESGKKIRIDCRYKCLRSCDPETAPYCIADAMFSAAGGDLDNAVVFCGADVVKINKIGSVKELLDGLVNETLSELSKS